MNHLVSHPTKQPSSQSVNRPVNQWMNEYRISDSWWVGGWQKHLAYFYACQSDRSTEHQWKWKWMLMSLDRAFSADIWVHVRATALFVTVFVFHDSFTLSHTHTKIAPVIFCAYLKVSLRFFWLPFLSTQEMYKAWSLISLLFLIILCVYVFWCFVTSFCISHNKTYHLRCCDKTKTFSSIWLCYL